MSYGTGIGDDSDSDSDPDQTETYDPDPFPCFPSSIVTVPSIVCQVFFLIVVNSTLGNLYKKVMISNFLDVQGHAQAVTRTHEYNST